MDNSSNVITVHQDDSEQALAVRARQNAVLCILGLLFNLPILLVVCLSVRLRRCAKYQLIASLSLADLMVSAVYLPLDTSMAFHGGRWTHGCRLLLFTYGLQEFVIPTIASLSLAALCLEHCITLFCCVTPSVSRWVVVTGVVVPWGAGFLALVPVFSERFVGDSGAFSAPCRTGETWNLSTLLLLVGGFGFAPILVLVGSLLLMLGSHCCRPPDDRLAARAIVSRSEGVFVTHEMGDTLLACLISLACNLPFLLHFLLHLRCVGGACHSPRRVQHALDVLHTAESVFFPAVWTLGMEFRRGLFTSCKCCYLRCDVDSGSHPG